MAEIGSEGGSRLGAKPAPALVRAQRRARRLTRPWQPALDPTGAGEASGGVQAAFPGWPCYRQRRHGDGRKKKVKGSWRGGCWWQSALGQSPLGDTPGRSRQLGRGREEGRRALLDSGSCFGSHLVRARQRACQLVGPGPRALDSTGTRKASGGLRAAFPGWPCHRNGRHSDGKQRRRKEEKKEKKGKKKKASRGGVGWPPVAIGTGPVIGSRHTRLLDAAGEEEASWTAGARLVGRGLGGLPRPAVPSPRKAR